MTLEDLDLSFREQVIFRLRALYSRCGYSRFRMNKFEEYDFYVRNKAFLLSDNVITFTDLNGRLMALKPDVTLSIVKSTSDRPDSLQKLYYNETVYRPARGGHAFRELMQVGLECIGAIDDGCIGEVTVLAAGSLKQIHENCVLNVSHLGLLTKILDAAGIQDNRKRELLKRIGEKNLHELTAVCKDLGVEARYVEALRKVLQCSIDAGQALSELRELPEDLVDMAAVQQLEKVVGVLKENGMETMLRLDFSAVDDMRYYNGIVFKGYVQGIPDSVLSGGQYDPLMRKLGRSAGAIGFAVYVDDLERLEPVGSVG